MTTENNYIKPISFAQNALKHGLILAGITITLTILYYLFDVQIMTTAFSMLSSSLSFAIMVAIFVLGVRHYRRHGLGGKISFLTAWLQIISIGMIGNVVIALFSYLFYTYVAPEYLISQLDAFVEMMESYNLSEELVDKSIEQFKEGIKPLKMLQSTITSGLIGSAIIGLIIAIFIKKDTTTPAISNQ